MLLNIFLNCFFFYKLSIISPNYIFSRFLQFILKNFYNLCIFLIFLHKIQNGSIDKSYGIHVASLAHLPKDVIDRSKDILDIYEHKNEKKEVFTQTSLFELSEEEVKKEEKTNEIEEKIKKINPLEMSPMEALNFLYELKKNS